MSIDLSTLTYSDLLKLQCELNTAISERKADEEGKAKKEWLTCDQGGKKYLGTIEDLRKRYEKLSKACEKTKDVTLKVRMGVSLSPIGFDDLLQRRWGQSLCEVFNVDCSGELLNPEVCGTIGSDVQAQIDDTMSNLCEEAAGIYSDLKEQLEDFLEDFNGFIKEFREDAGDAFSLVPSDLVRANKPKAKKQAAKKGKR